MKRSRINQIMAEADDMIRRHGFVLPPFAYWSPEVFKARTDAALVRVLPTLKIPPIPVWLVVHREIRTSPRIRAVFDFLSESIPAALEPA